MNRTGQSVISRLMTLQAEHRCVRLTALGSDGFHCSVFLLMFVVSTELPGLELILLRHSETATLLRGQMLLPVYSSTVVATSISKPVRVDLGPDFVRWQLPIKKQAQRNTCSVMAMVGGMEYAVSKKLRRGMQLSPEYLNWACNQIIHNTKDDRGQFFHHLLQGYEKYGICEASQMPYAARFNPQYLPSHNATNSARWVKAMGLRAHWIKTHDGKAGVSAEHIEQIKETLRQGWPVCAGSFHSLLMVGYEDSREKPGGGEFFLRDSGGGNEKTMSYDAAQKRLCDIVWFDTDSFSIQPLTR